MRSLRNRVAHLEALNGWCPGKSIEDMSDSELEHLIMRECGLAQDGLTDAYLQQLVMEAANE